MEKEKVLEKKRFEDYTPEELKEIAKQREIQKAELIKHYEEELPFLRLQAEYEESLTRIDVAKMQRLEIMIAKAQMTAPPAEGSIPPQPEKE